jgi:NAD(P)-dependent dehydrogenase (short-subunit alcohol dehydrogenase family)
MAREASPGPWTDVPRQDGRRFIVTGASGGLGLETARILAHRGAHVVLAVRNPAKGEAAAASIGGDVEVRPLDVSDLGSVRAFAAETGPVDVLINNAGIMGVPFGTSADGVELHFATNHLGHFALTNLLWPALAADGGARVVALSSTGHKISGIRFDDLQFETGYDKWQAYGQAKSANSLFAVHLDALGQDAGVRAFAAHPGGIRTPLQRHLAREEMIASGWMDEEGNLDERFKTPEQGASTSTWAATSPTLDGIGGVYCENCNIAEPTVPGSPTARIEGVDAHAIDPDVAARLWTVSAALTEVNAFAAA